MGFDRFGAVFECSVLTISMHKNVCFFIWSLALEQLYLSVL